MTLLKNCSIIYGLMRKEVAIKEGQLCTFKGATVRVIKPTNNNMWLVGTHGQLWGFAKEQDLKPVSRTKTRAYEGMPSLSDKILGAVGLLSVALIVGLTIVLS